MKVPIFYLFILVATIWLHGCTGVPESNENATTRITVGPGPEDMVIDTVNGIPRLLVSCTGRRESHRPYGEIESVEPATGKRTIMTRKGDPDGLKFRPHGIYLDGSMLYVISHENEPGDHPVLVYRVRGENLEFVEVIRSPLLHSPNALVTGPRGEIYVVNDSGKRGSIAEKALKLKRASVVRLEKDADGKWDARTVARELGYPAGINRIGDQLFAGDVLLHRIYVFTITEEGLVPEEQIKGMRGNDNIRIHEGKILTPGHVKPFRFIKHARDPEKLSPVEVFLADPGTGQVSTLFRTGGSLISAGSAAVIYGNDLYICQVFDPFILKVRLDP